MKVAIVGSRDYPSLNKVAKYVEGLPPDTEVISGGARGVDLWAEQWARDRGLKTTVFNADWSKGRGAGMERNVLMVKECDRVVAFWDGESKGTAHTIQTAAELGKPCEVIQP